LRSASCLMKNCHQNMHQLLNRGCTACVQRRRERRGARRREIFFSDPYIAFVTLCCSKWLYLCSRYQRVTISGGRIQVHDVLDTRAHPPMCLRAAVLSSGSSTASKPLGSLASKEISVQFWVTVDIMVCFVVREVVQQFEICIFHIQELGFPCNLSACMRYVFMSRLHLVLGK